MNPGEWIESPDPRQLWITTTAVLALLIAWSITAKLHRNGRTSPEMHHELILRLRTWAIIIPLTVLPILAGPIGIAIAIFLLGLICYREFARALNFQTDPLVMASIGLGLLVIATAILQHNHHLLLFSAPLVALLTSCAMLFRDQPSGFLKRIAFINLGFMLCCLWPGHLGFLGSGPGQGTILLWFILCTELNDVFAFVAGKTFGRRSLCPRTSPGKTREGFIGSIILTTTFATLSGHLLFQDHYLGNILILIPVGALISISGTIGDLILSSIKRDLHLKDLSHSLPGHGGILDRCDSLIFAAPVMALTLGLLESWKFLTLFLP